MFDLFAVGHTMGHKRTNFCAAPLSFVLEIDVTMTKMKNPMPKFQNDFSGLIAIDE